MEIHIQRARLAQCFYDIKGMRGDTLDRSRHETARERLRQIIEAAGRLTKLTPVPLA